MADKMWDILRFLKNPEGDKPAGDTESQSANAEKKEIDSQLMSAIERTEAAIDEALVKEAALSGYPSEETGVGQEEAFVLSGGVDDDSGSQAHSAENEFVKKQELQAEEISNEADESDGKEDEKEDNKESDLPFSDVPDEADSDLEDPSEERLLKIPLSNIRPNPFQPRKIMGENEITELSESIKELGVLQPILVREQNSGYELIAGERRLRAAQRAGLHDIPAMVVVTEPLTQQIIALVENIQRKNLSAIEEAICLQDIISKTGWSQTELSRRTGRSQASIANKIRLLRLDPSVQELVIAGKLGERQARSLLSLSVEEQKLLAQKAIDEDLSARALEELSENWDSGTGSARKISKPKQGSAEGPAGDLLGDIATLINRHRGKGVSAQWKVKQMDQSSLVVEISVDLLSGTQTAETDGDA